MNTPGTAETNFANRAVAPLEQTNDVAVQREALLRQLLDGPYDGQNFGNYDYARDSGLLDEFYYDPASGRDGIQHILSGEVVVNDNGDSQVEGFHHEPSGTMLAYGDQTFGAVDRTHLQDANSKQRAEFREHAFEPYRARVDVAGLRKVTLQTDPKTGEPAAVETKNSMFPKEYDGLAVLQAIRIAKHTRDRSQDTLTDNGLVMANGQSVMVDNVSPMRIRMLLDPRTEQVVSAMPAVKASGIMKLGKESIDHFIYGDGATVKLVK